MDNESFPETTNQNTEPIYGINKKSKLIFKTGLAFLLVSNAIVAFTDPDSFRSLLESNFIGSKLPDQLLEIMVVFAGINDLILAFLVLLGKWKNIVYIWIGFWFATIAAVKIMNLIL